MEKPTESQIRYASLHGLAVKPGMSKQDVSALLDEFEEADPKAARKRQRINAWRADKAAKEWAEACGPELLDAERRWEDFIKRNETMAAVYKRGSKVTADIVVLDCAYIEGKRTKKLYIDGYVVKVTKDSFGEWVEQGRQFRVAIDKLLHYKPLGKYDFASQDTVQKYRRDIGACEHVARTLGIDASPAPSPP